MIDQTSTATSPPTDDGVGGDVDGAPSSEHGSQNALTGADPGASTSIEVRPESALHTDKGTTTIAEVVSTGLTESG